MAQVSVSINGRGYQISCDAGQEEHLQRLAEFVDKKVSELVSGMGQVGDSRLLVMAALLIADELAESYGKLRDVEGDGALAEEAEKLADSLATSIDALALRLETVAEKLAQP